jgi:tRNA(Ile)-lysidine synthase
VSKLIDRVEHNILSRQLLKSGQEILVAVSGGVDSMTLLVVLNRLASRHGWRLAVAHFNHRLRGRQAGADERFVRKQAGLLALPFVSESGDVKALAISRKLSIEMAARRLRHEFLARTARKLRIRSVALAHHGDDQVELFFLRLFRGSGGEGLAGLRWASPSSANPKIELIRPLLGMPKAELDLFAQAEGIPFREDATNKDPEHERNHIRHALMPFLSREFSPGIRPAVLRTIEIIGVESDLADEHARAWLASAGARDFERLHSAVQRRVLLRQLFQLGATPDFELVEQLRQKPNSPFPLASGLVVWRDCNGILHTRSALEAPAFDTGERTISLVGGQGEAGFAGCLISWKSNRRRDKNLSAMKRHGGGESFDADKVGSVVHLRHWRPGDRFQPIGMACAVKLHDWFINRKVARERRHHLVVATTGCGEIFWIEGQRIADGCKVTVQTRRVLEWRWSRTTLDESVKPPPTGL